jgi:cobalt-zinc-cadmium efflux system membrane fusion protein
MHKRIFIFWLFFTFISACSDKDKNNIAIKLDPNEIIAKPELLKQLEIEAAQERSIKRTLDIPGSVEVKQNLLAKIGSPVKGRITDIKVHLGQNVKKGDVLAVVSSTELAKMQLEYIKSAQQVELKSKAFMRAELLLAEDVLSEAQMLERKTELAAAKAEMEGSKGQLAVLGMADNEIKNLKSETQIDSLSYIQAKIDGKVIVKNVNIGQVVEPVDEIFTIASLKEVWGVAQVPERQISFLSQGDDVLIEVPAYDAKQVEGKISYLGDIVDPITRTISIRTEISNKDFLLKPDMLITMKVSGQKVNKIGVPIEAIVNIEDEENIFIKLNDNKFILRPVTTGIKDKKFIHIEQGLNPGEEYVAKGAFHLNNERMYKKE